MKYVHFTDLTKSDIEQMKEHQEKVIAPKDSDKISFLHAISPKDIEQVGNELRITKSISIINSPEFSYSDYDSDYLIVYKYLENDWYLNRIISIHGRLDPIHLEQMNIDDIGLNIHEPLNENQLIKLYKLLKHYENSIWLKDKIYSILTNVKDFHIKCTNIFKYEFEIRLIRINHTIKLSSKNGIDFSCYMTQIQAISIPNLINSGELNRLLGIIEKSYRNRYFDSEECIPTMNLGEIDTIVQTFKMFYELEERDLIPINTYLSFLVFSVYNKDLSFGESLKLNFVKVKDFVFSVRIVDSISENTLFTKNFTDSKDIYRFTKHFKENLI